MEPPVTATRRAVVALAASGGALLLAARNAQAVPAATDLNTFLRIAPDNTITILCSKSEMGQGTHTGIAVLVAEELDAAWDGLRVETADLLPRYVADDQDMRTAGSDAITGGFETLRQIGAVAREMLKQAAAERWRVAPAELRTADSQVFHDRSGRRAAYGQLAAAAARLTPPQAPPLRAASDWKLIGAPLHRVDAAAKVAGAARFGVDVEVPGMLVGTVRHCPAFGGRLTSVDPAPALAVRGVAQVVALPAAVAVLATGYWPAAKGVLALDPVWDLGPNAKLDDAAIGRRLDAALATAQVGPTGGDVEAALKTAARTISATYDVPYLHHWLIEPINATAWARDGGCEIWAPLQGQRATQKAVAAALGLDPARVVVHTTYVGGSFGRRMQTDVTVQAALASRAAGRPVKLIWSREEDTRHGFYRPRARATFTAGVDARGRPVAIRSAMAENSTLQDYARRYMSRLFDDIPHQLAHDMAGQAYGVPNFRFAHADVELGVPVGAWHGVQYSHNGFIGESMIDEMAHLAGADPLAFRRDNAADPRHVALLDRVAAMSGWGRKLPAGHGLGVAIVPCFGATVAQAVEVRVRDRAVKVVAAWCAIDCGLAVYPPGVVTQMITGLNAGLSVAFHGAVNIREGGVIQANFDAEPLIRMAQAPPVEVAIVSSGEKIGGAGEGGLPPAAPALTNAVFAASGVRVRRLPMVLDGWTLV